MNSAVNPAIQAVQRPGGLVQTQPVYIDPATGLAAPPITTDSMNDESIGSSTPEVTVDQPAVTEETVSTADESTPDSSDDESSDEGQTSEEIADRPQDGEIAK